MSLEEGFALVNADGGYSHYTKMTEGQLPVVAIGPISNDLVTRRHGLKICVKT